jgi:predicted nucleic acid-binding protein
VIVADASAAVELLLARPRAGAIRAALEPHPELHVPEHFHVEVLSALRRFSIRRELSDRRSAVALEALGELRVIRYPVLDLADLADAVWDLRPALTAYDAAYLALARRLDVRVVTIDGGLAAAARADGRLVPLTG